MPKISHFKKQDPAICRSRAYPNVAEQLGAYQKILKAILAASPELRLVLENDAPDALAIFDEVSDVKVRIPKAPRRKRKPGQ